MLDAAFGGFPILCLELRVPIAFTTARAEMLEEVEHCAVHSGVKHCGQRRRFASDGRVSRGRTLMLSLISNVVKESEKGSRPNLAASADSPDPTLVRDLAQLVTQVSSALTFIVMLGMYSPISAIT